MKNAVLKCELKLKESFASFNLFWGVQIVICDICRVCWPFRAVAFDNIKLHSCCFSSSHATSTTISTEKLLFYFANFERFSWLLIWYRVGLEWHYQSNLSNWLLFTNRIWVRRNHLLLLLRFLMFFPHAILRSGRVLFFSLSNDWTL